MLISHRYKFIFIKTKKTAGTSLEIALSPFLGPEDVITHISPEDEQLRQQLGGRGPQHFYISPSRWSWQEWKQYLKNRERPYFYNHMPAREIRRYIGNRVWDTYFKFCFERNPWDKVISWYWWEHKEASRPSLETFICAGRAADLAAEGGSSLYTIDGKVAVDRIYQYEQLDSAVAELAQRLGLPAVPSLPNAKGQFRKDRRSWREVYSAHERQVVAELFAREISELGYEF
jgi:hypothetical protein